MSWIQHNPMFSEFCRIDGLPYLKLFTGTSSYNKKHVGFMGYYENPKGGPDPAGTVHYKLSDVPREMRKMVSG